MPRRGIAVALVLGLVFALVPIGVASGATSWTITTLVTSDDQIFDPMISGNRVVWTEQVAGDTDSGEIYTRVIGGAAPQNVSSRADQFDEVPSVSGNRIAWVGWVSGGREIFTWTLGDIAPTNVSNSASRSDEDVQVSGNRLFWSGVNELAEPDTEIYTWAPGDVAPTNVSNNPGSAISDTTVRVSGDRVVWLGVDPVGLDVEVYTWAVSDPVKRNLSDNTVNDSNPSVSGNRIVWDNASEGDWDIYTRVVGDAGPVNIGRDGINDYLATVSGNRIVWEGEVNGTPENDVFMYTMGAAAPVNLTNSPDVYDSEPRIAGDYAVWGAYDGDGEIMAWSPAGVVRLTDDGDEDYHHRISEDGIAWVQRVGDWETGTFSILTAEPTVTGLTVVPVAGTTRIGTAIEASKKAYPVDGSVDTVVIATSLNWPDALGGAALAGAVDGPILLTNPTSLAPEVLSEITRLGATHAYILGGPSAVGASVETALKSKLGTGNVKRLAGAGRYETARLIAAETVSALGPTYGGVAFLATGANFPDALGASPLAAANGWPIYLVNPTTGADAALVNALKSDGVDDVLVLGGTGVISEAIKNGLGVKSTLRLAGDNRYDTARAVATYGTGPAGGLSWNRLAIATGENFPDALAGGVLQGKSGSVLLLTPSKSLNPGVAGVLATNKAVIGEVRFLGGEGAVSLAVRTAVSNALK